MHTPHRLLASILIGFSLSACSSLDDLMASEPVDYKSTVRGEPLTLPPDLSRSQINPQYSTYGGPASAIAYQKAVDKAAKEQKANGGVLPHSSDIQVMRSGDKRWLQINRDANVVYQDVISFWTNEGFTINREDPKVGLIETDWAENRAKIPANFLRRAIGSVVDMVSDSGERDRFTTRLERVNGKTEVHIRHERLVETQMDKDGTTFKWLPAPEDPEVNAIMLARLMSYMGADKQEAKAAVESAKGPAADQYRAQFVEGDVALSLAQASDKTFKQVGTALSSVGFTIDKTDAETSSYLVRYLDTDTGEKRKSANIISQLWGDKGNLTPLPYVIHIEGDKAKSLIRVYNQQGEVDRSETAMRILSVLREKL